MRVQLPDGKIAQFPDSMTTDQIEQVIRKQYKPTSAITGKPEPTTQERFAAQADYNRALGSAAGDVALTMAAPQLAIPKTAGKLAGLGFKGVNALLRGAGSAAGSGAGAAAGQYLGGGGIDAKAAGEHAALGGATELGMSALGGSAKLAGKALKPLFEIVPDITFSGTAVKRWINDNVKRQATKRAEKFLMDVAPESVKAQKSAADSLSVMVNNAYSENGAVYNLYKDALKEAAEKNAGPAKVVREVVNGDGSKSYIVSKVETKDGVGGQFLTPEGRYKTQAEAEAAAGVKMGAEPVTEGHISVKNTADVVRGWIDNAGVPPDATGVQIRDAAMKMPAYTKTVRDFLSKLEKQDTLSRREMEYLMANVLNNRNWSKLNPDQQSAREALKEALMKDLDAFAPSAAGFKSDADEQFKALIKFNAVRRIYNRAMSRIPGGTGEKTLDPYQLYEEIYANKKRILQDKELSKLWPALEQEATAALEASKKLRKSSIDVGPGSIFSRGLGGAAGGFLFGPPGVPVAEGIGAATAWVLLSAPEKTALKKLFRGAKATGKAAVKTGIHMAGEEVNFDD